MYMIRRKYPNSTAGMVAHCNDDVTRDAERAYWSATNIGGSYATIRDLCGVFRSERTQPYAYGVPSEHVSGSLPHSGQNARRRALEAIRTCYNTTATVVKPHQDVHSRQAAPATIPPAQLEEDIISHGNTLNRSTYGYLSITNPFQKFIKRSHIYLFR
jgi:hypothetical protein